MQLRALPATRLTEFGLQRRRRVRRLGSLPVAAMAAFSVLAIIGAIALAAPLLAPHDPLTQSLGGRAKPPEWMEGGATGHLLGTDELGRDVLSRIIYGARVSLGIGLTGALIGTVLGTTLGVIAGFFRGWADWIIMLAVDAQLAIPFLVIALIAIAAIGKGIATLAILAGISSWISFTRACRSTVLSLREREFVTAARAIGASDPLIVRRHVLPNLASIIVVIATVELRGMILFEAGLSFLGLGVPPPRPSWGSMLDGGRPYLLTAWWISVFPGVALMLTVLTASLIGDWLRDRFDPTAQADR